jgi:hypothetical protein
MVSARGRSMVSSVESLVVVKSARRSNSRAGVGGVVRRADVVLNSRRGKTSGSGRSGNLRVVNSALALVALPELHARALGVAVGGAGTVALLLLVVLGHEKLEGDGDEEEEPRRN